MSTSLINIRFHAESIPSKIVKMNLFWWTVYPGLIEDNRTKGIEREAMLSTGELICPFHSFNKKKHFNRYSLGSWKYKDLSKIISNWNTKEQFHAKEGP